MRWVLLLSLLSAGCRGPGAVSPLPVARVVVAPAPVSTAAASLAPPPSVRVDGAPPRIRFGAITISGSLPPLTVQRTVRRHYEAFRRCYESRLAANPKLEGRVVVRLVVGDDGAVRKLQKGGSDVPDPELIDCATAEFARTVFPKSGSETTVVYPIMFAPPWNGAPAGMLPVPGGWFVMGSDTGGQEDEHPSHLVKVEGFFLDRTAVTNRAYDECVHAGKCRAPAASSTGSFGPDAAFRGPEQPVSSISWDDAHTYCAFVGKRLPTEAEFERAARGDDERMYPWGDEPPTPDRAVFVTTRTAIVGTHPAGAGPYGHVDLAGNVWEWIEDLYDPYAYRRPGAGRGVPGTCPEIVATQDALRSSGQQGFTGSNPIPTECEHVLRGGAFNYGGDGLRATNRVHHPGRFTLIMSGVRCAKDVD